LPESPIANTNKMAYAHKIIFGFLMVTASQKMNLG
jgi:hypothetical protein